MNEKLNQILSYLKENEKKGFERRTKFSLILEFVNSLSSIDEYMSKLIRDGHIRLFLHPNIGLKDELSIDYNEKLIYSVSKKGAHFIREGGY